MNKIAIAAALLLGTATPALAVTIGNEATGESIFEFGNPDSQTYGQVFTAPITGTMTSFTLYLNEGVGALRGAVGTWNGTSAFGENFGSPSTLFLSAPVVSPIGGGAQAYTFTPNIGVVSGQLYVAFISVYGVQEGTGRSSMPSGTAAPGLNYFVWHNSSENPTPDPFGNPSWNYGFDLGHARFDASFSSGMVPEPSNWTMMIAGFGLVGATLRRRRALAA